MTLESRAPWKVTKLPDWERSLDRLALTSTLEHVEHAATTPGRPSRDWAVALDDLARLFDVAPVVRQEFSRDPRVLAGLRVWFGRRTPPGTDRARLEGYVEAVGKALSDWKLLRSLAGPRSAEYRQAWAHVIELVTATVARNQRACEADRQELVSSVLNEKVFPFGDPALHRFRFEGTFTSFLAIVAARHVIDLIRSGRYQPGNRSLLDPTEVDALPEAYARHDASPGEAVFGQALRAALVACMEAQSRKDDHQAPIAAAWLTHADSSDPADLRQVSLEVCADASDGNRRVRLTRLRAELRSCLERKGYPNFSNRRTGRTP